MYEFEGFRLDTERRLLLSAKTGEPLQVSPKAIETLAYLVERRGQLVEKRALMKAIWPHAVVEDNTLDRNISTLRRALGEKAGENRFIATVPGRGYRFVAVIRSSPDAPESGSTEPDRGSGCVAAEPPVSDEVPSLAPRRNLAKAVVGWAAIGLAVTVSAIGLIGLQRAQRDAGTGSVAAASAAAAGLSSDPAPAASVAVMPFANLTGDSGLQYLCDGIANELIYSLARVAGLKVPARTSSFAYRGRDIDVREIARDLGVATVVEGSVRNEGDRLRVTVQLVDARTGFRVWSQDYDRTVDDTFALQAELASQVVQALSPSLHSGIAEARQQSATVNKEAYRLFLEANALVGANESNLRKAIGLYDRALELDSEFSRAFAARATTRLVLVYRGILPLDGAALAESDARRAVSLDPRAADAYAALGTLLTLRGRWLDGEASYRAAFSISPNDPLIIGNHTMALASTGRLRATLEESERAYDLAPLALPAIMRRAMAHSLLEQDAPAVRDATVRMSFGAPRDDGGVPFILASAAHRAGRHTEAAEHLLAYMPADARSAGGANALALAYEAAANPEKRFEAVAALRRLESEVPFVDLLQSSGPLLIVLYAMAGDLDGAYGVAHRALEEHLRNNFVGTNWFAIWLPSMQPFRQDPRFSALVRRLGLPEYWNVHGPPDGCVLQHNDITCR